MNQYKEEELVAGSPPESRITHNFILTVIMFVWFVWGLMWIMAWIFGLWCFAYNGTFMQNWVGLLTAILMGPFYWIYYVYTDGYCVSGSRKQQVQSQIRKNIQIIGKKLKKKSNKKRV